GPQMPIGHGWFDIRAHGRSWVTLQGCDDHSGCAMKPSTDAAVVPKVMSRKPAPRARFLKKSQKRVRPRPVLDVQKSPGFQNCFHSSAVTPQYPARTKAQARSATPVRTPSDM